LDPSATRRTETRRARGFRRLSGLDRSGPRPRQTRRGEPLRPLTIPNLVGYLRLAAVPPYLIIALSSGDGRTAPAAVLYLWITLGDYLDGFLARATGQYSRMGALLDPIIDRLSVLAGIVVCWNFDLLPRWGLAIVAAREISVLLLSEAALRRGLEIEINWVGRIGALLVFGGLFWTQVIDSWITDAMFFAGLFAGLLATIIYVRSGRAAARTAPAE
jgi:CDP-diacylglycerol--glycerol-3-phosphate 3-phosphatidyltransferase